MAGNEKIAPTFNENPMGRYTEKARFKTLNWGSNAYVPERELNEMQWLQTEQVSELIRTMTKSGVLTVNIDEDDENDEHNRSKCFKIFNNDEEHTNSFEMPPFNVVMNGNIVNVYAYRDGEIKNSLVRLPNPPVAGTRNDFIFLEFWFEELNGNDLVYAYGNELNDALDYHIIDERINLETSRRIQLKWKLSLHEDYDGKCENGFVDDDGTPNEDVHPSVSAGYIRKDYFFKATEHDPYLYIVGDGNKTKIHTFDGYIYAIPLFCIKRINNSGFDAENNPTGGIDYVEGGEPADRPDGKYSNVIYHDQVVDLRHLAAIGEEQYDKIYFTLRDLYKYQTYLKNKLNRLSHDMESANYILQNIGYSIPSIHDDEVYGLTSFRQNGVTSGGYITETDEDIALVYRKNKYFVGWDLMKKDYVVIPTVVDYDSENLGQIGDLFVTKENKYFVIHNTGAKGLKMHLTAVGIEKNKVISDKDLFNGLEGTKIELGFDLDVNRHFIYICPNENTNGRNGEIYVKIGLRDFTVYNTGLTTDDSGEVTSTIGNEFTWVVIDTYNSDIQNIELFTELLNGLTGAQHESVSFGDAYTLLLGTPFITSNAVIEDGVIGDVYANTEDDNQVTVYNTGTNEEDIHIQCMVFNEVFYNELYDTIDVKKLLNIDKIS